MRLLDFPGSPAVKTASSAGGKGLGTKNPGLGTKIPYAVWGKNFF